MYMLFRQAIDSSACLLQDEAKESRMRVAGLIETIQSTQDKRSALYQSYEDAVNKFKTSKDSSAFTQSRKKVDGDYKQLTQQVNTLLSQVKAEGSDSAEKVGCAVLFSSQLCDCRNWMWGRSDR